MKLGDLYMDPVLASLRWYTGGEYDELNTALRMATPLPPSIDAHWKNIQTGFAAAHPITEPITVYRGQRANIVGPVLAPLSTAKTIRGTEDFVGQKCCMLVITVSPGTKVIDISHISEIPSESEILLPPGGTLVLTHRDIVEYQYTYEKRTLETLYVTYIPPVHVTLANIALPVAPTLRAAVRELTIEQVVDMISPAEYEFVETLDDAMTLLSTLPHELSSTLLREAATRLHLLATGAHKCRTA